MRKPLIGIIGLIADLYKKKMPDFVSNLDIYLKSLVKNFSKFADTVSFFIIHTLDTAEKSFKKMVKSNVDGVVICFLSYSPSLIIEPVFENYNIPVLIWNTQQIKEISQNFKAEDMINNHGMHEVQDLTSVWTRKERLFLLITGHPEQKDTITKIERWCRCACILSELKKIKVGRLRGMFKDRGDSSVSNSYIKKILGPLLLILL